MFKSSATVAGALCGALLLTACGGGGGDAEDSTTLRLSNFVSEDHPYAQAFAAWMEQVEEATDGAVTFETNYNGSLCPSAEQLSCVGDSTVDMAMITPAYTPEMVLSNIGGVAFQNGDPQVVGDALNALYEAGGPFRDELAERGVTPLFAFGDTKPVLGATTEISSFADLEGLSARTGGAMTAGVQPLGVEPVAIAPEEVYESLERGVVQAAILPVSSQVDYRLQEVVEHFYDIGEFTGVYASHVYGINTDVWEGLSEEVREAMTAASEDVAARFQADFSVPNVAENCAVLTEAGQTVQRLTPAGDGEAWAAEAGDAQKKAWIELATEAGVSDAAGFLDDYLAELTRAEADVEPTPNNFEICGEAS